MSRRPILPAFFLSSALLWGCQSVDTTQGGTVGVDRQQYMAVSSQEVEAGAKQAYAQMMAEAQKKNALDRDAAQVARVRNITQRVNGHPKGIAKLGGPATSTAGSIPS